MSLLDTLDPLIRGFAGDLFDIAAAQGLHPRVTSARRSHALQETLYRRYQEGLSRYPAAVPGDSAHEYGLAFDLVVPDPGYQRGLGKLWRSWGGNYGNEEDPIHFEYPSWRARVGISGAAPAPPDYSIGRLLIQAEDLALSWIPTPIRGMIDTAELATSILSLTGRSPGPLLYYIAHPAEYFDALYTILWSLILKALRG